MVKQYVSLLLFIVLIVHPELPAQDEGPVFGYDQARHLLSRAGFSGTPGEIEALAALGLDEAVARIISGKMSDRSPRAFVFEKFERPPTSRSAKELTKAEREKNRRKRDQARRRWDDRQIARFRSWWMEGMLDTQHPFQEKLTLFWHGYFTSSYRTVRNSRRMVAQNDLFRREGMGNFRTLLRRVARDPAMMRYLDNDRNRRDAPNENFAREVMELFTLGEGHYSEKDIKECARALTGWINGRNGAQFVKQRHDAGAKTILGRTGNYDTDDALAVLLQRPEATEHVAGRILNYFVGPELPEGMHQRYAGLLRELDWDLMPFFRTLFTDPQFYSPNVMGNRIQSPVEFIVGTARRLGENPPGWLLVTFCDQLGQSIMYPPDVKGWDGGEAWITTASFMQRGNFARYVVTGFDRMVVTEDFAMNKDGTVDQKMVRSGVNRIMRGVGNRRWQPETGLREFVLLSGAREPEQIVDLFCRRFLGVPVTDEARTSLLGFLEDELKTDATRIRTQRALGYSEALLGRLVHLIVSLPEAQLG